MTEEPEVPAEESAPKPTGYVIIHRRAVGSTMYFGPFATVQEAFDWQATVGDQERIVPVLVAMFKTVDWTL
jgi:hypothetical protein